MPEIERPLILLANDDGQARRGIRTMRDALSRHADVVIVAPEVEQSAASHALSLHRPLRLRRVEDGIFAVDGTPADCVYVALHHPRVLQRRPDLVVSGLNHGLNLGQDVFYSGTVAAAREGALRGIPAIAASAAREVDRQSACEVVARLASRLLERWTSSRTPLLNVNFPPKWTGEVRVTRIGSRNYEELLDIRKDPRGREYFWLGGAGVTHSPEPDTDTDAHDAGVASITPLLLDLTAHDDRAAASSLLV
jgi:5'-nucleotidase